MLPPSFPSSLHKTSHHCVCFEQRTLWSFASRCNWKIGGALEEPEKSASLGEGPLCKVPLAPSEGHHAFHCSGKGQTFAVSINPAQSIIGRGDGSSWLLGQRHAGSQSFPLLTALYPLRAWGITGNHRRFLKSYPETCGGEYLGIWGDTRTGAGGVSNRLRSFLGTS